MAAVSPATPVFLMFMAVRTALVIGGTSVIFRALGEGKRQLLGNLLNVILNPIMISGFGWNIPGVAIAGMGVRYKAFH